MADFKRFKTQEIPFILDGQTIVKTITKNTTCFDVIKKLPILSCPLAVFESVDGVEKELSGKVKLLKVWRAHGPNKKVAFVIRKTSVENKGRKIASKLFSDRRNCGNHIAKSQSNGLLKETFRQVSDLTFFARSQKTKVDALYKNSNGESVTSKQETITRRILSRASVNSMDAFLAKADLDEMARILSFCGNVTAEKLGQKVQKQQTTNTASEENTEADRSNIKKHMIHYSLTSLKLGLKKKYKTKSKVTRTTSTGTISSTDTGYQSTGSEDTSASESKHAPQSDFGSSIHKRHTSIFSNLRGLRHSTPIIASRYQKRRADDTDRTFIEDCSVTSDKLKYFDECQGRDIILQRFMNDQDISASSFIGCDVATTSSMKSQRRDRYSNPVFSNQEEKCRFLWDQYCDSDSDSESEISVPRYSLDIGFHAETTNQDTTSQARPRTLKRDSAISNLNRFTLVSRDIGLDISKDGSSFDHSFDCSFPTMDEFSLDLSYSFDDSESKAGYSDHSMDSFMKTRSFQDVTDDVTTLV